MKRIMLCFVALIALLLMSCLPASAQVTSSLSGTVIDPSGAVVPGADVTVKNEGTGAEYKTITAGNGTFEVPSLNAGTYTVTVDFPGFKQAVMKGVAVLASTPASVRAIKLEIGTKGETVIVEGAGQVLQTQSAEVSTTIVGRQITEIPFTSRDALDLVLLMPGTFTQTNPRSSTINGLPQSMLSITIDGVNVQDNTNKSGDGFYTWVRPRIDAIEQVTVSTSTQGAESSGESAVQIKFVTRSGNNQYSGSLYEYHRNPTLGANYWFTNRDNRAPTGWDWSKAYYVAPRDRILLNQYGVRIGGPIQVPKSIFGPLGFDGHDRAFFFANYEEFRLPQQISNTRTIFHPRTQQGYYRYIVTNAGVRSIAEVDLMGLAQRSNQLSSWDPTVQKLLQDIRTAASSTGSIEVMEDPNKVADPNLQRYTFVAKGGDRRYFPTTRFDFNLTSKHSLGISYNYQRFLTDGFDYFQGGAPQFPGFPNYLLTASNRFSTSAILRSTFTPKMVNEAQFGVSGGTSCFGQNIGPGDFTGPLANQGGFNMGFRGGATSPTRSSGPSRRNGPVKSLNDTLTWTRGTHNLSLGGSFSNVSTWSWSQTVVPSVAFDVDTTYDPAKDMFTTANRPINFPGLSSTTTARQLYAFFTGRVTSISGSANVGPDGNYHYIGPNENRGRMRQLGFFVSDSWRFRPNLTFTGGLRWDIQLPYAGLNDSYAYINLTDVWGISGVGNLFKPGTMTGSPTTYKAYVPGTPLYKNIYDNVAPSIGFAWTPKFEGFLGKFLNSSTVLRGGSSISYSRYGTENYSGLLTGGIPARSISANRSQSIGNLVSNTGTDTWPLLFRQRERLGPPNFLVAPVFPTTGSISDGGGTFDPNARLPYVISWNFGLQREITKNMVVEVRYMGNRGMQFTRDTWVNDVEYNILENGIYQEFWKAQANMYANIAAGMTNQTWAYTGQPGTSPLPIAMAYLQGMKGTDVTNPAKYTSSQFLTNQWLFDKIWPANPPDYAGLFDGNSTFRANGIAAGRPANDLLTNPDKRWGTYWRGNGGRSYYDSMTVEFRRRMAAGLLVQANYTFARGFSLTSPSLRAEWYKVPGTNSTPGAFKANWIYELPIGRNKTLLSDMRPSLNRFFGGWEFHGMVRIQSGNPMSFSGYNMVGMTRDEFQKAVKLRFDDAGGIIFWLPDDIIKNTLAAFNTDTTTPTGYSTTYGVPHGRYLAPNNGPNCAEIYTGQCSNGGFVIYGLPFARWDLSLIKTANITERVKFELRAEFLNAFNNANFRASTSSIGGTNMGRVTTGYRDTSTTNDPGGRLIQFVGRINF